MRLSSRFVALFVLLISTMLAGSARADVVQPDGTVIPVISDPTARCHTQENMGGCLDEGEIAIGGMAGTINPIHDAHVDTETYDASCQLTFKVVSYGGSFYRHLFGWYPSKPGNTPPALKDMHVFMNCDETRQEGMSKMLSFPSGTGPIGFFVASGDFGPCPAVAADGTLAAEPASASYTEVRLNGRLRNGNPDPNVPGGYYRVLTYQSVAQPASFYFAWEDEVGASDNNYEDLITWVSGISCSAGGDACDTGQKGLCGPGTKQCRGGVLTCIGDRTPTPEKCNAIDDNCDGNIDEGDLCQPNFVCYHGSCVPNCTRGEFPCPAGTVCQADVGYCVDVGCVGMTCPAGQVCRAGACVADCQGVKCPFGQACRQGACIDVCASLTCDANFVCVPAYANGTDKDPSGVCSTCGCQGCAAGTQCIDKHCVPNDCAMVTCASGTHCVSGTCVDNCAGAMCPPGQKCDMGQCVIDPNAPRDAGTEAAPPPILTTTTTSTTTGVTTGGSPTGSGSGGSGSAGTGGAAGKSSARPPQRESTSCGCRTPGGRSSGTGLAPIAILALFAAARRTRKKRLW